MRYIPLVIAGFIMIANAASQATPLKQRLADKASNLPGTSGSTLSQTSASISDKVTVASIGNNLESGRVKDAVQVPSAMKNLREHLEADDKDCKDKDKNTSSSSSSSSLRGVYDGSKRSSRDRTDSPVRDSRKKRSDSSDSERSCKNTKSRSLSRDPDEKSLTNSVRFKGNDLDSAFGPRVFGKPSVQRSCAPSLGSGSRSNGNNCSLRGTQIPSADIQLESNRALGFHLQPDVQLNRNEESACVSAEETHREGCTKGAKYRHFAIKGDIVVSEKVTFKENSVEEEKTAGRAAKNTMAVETTDVGDILTGPQDSYTVTTHSPLEYTLSSDRVLSFPTNCQTDSQCSSVDDNYVCGYPERC